MSSLAPTIRRFHPATDRPAASEPAHDRLLSDTFGLLLAFAQKRTGRPPSRILLEDLDAESISAFLEHPERQRHNNAQTRNTRLSAIHSILRFATLRHPEHAALIARVLAIPPKRTDKPAVTFLTDPEVDTLPAAPDRHALDRSPRPRVPARDPNRAANLGANRPTMPRRLPCQMARSRSGRSRRPGQAHQ